MRRCLPLRLGLGLCLSDCVCRPVFGFQAEAVWRGDEAASVEYWSALDGAAAPDEPVEPGVRTPEGDTRVPCPHCGALHFAAGRSLSAMRWGCCLNGKLRQLPRWEEPPAPENDEESSAARYV